MDFKVGQVVTCKTTSVLSRNEETPMIYHVKAFYPAHFRTGRVVGCILYSDENQQRADRVRNHLRHAAWRDGRTDVLYFTHDENGQGTSHLVAHYM